MTTTIQISDSQWKKLSALKENSKETFIDVIEKLLKNKIKRNKKK